MHNWKGHYKFMVGWKLFLLGVLLLSSASPLVAQRAGDQGYGVMIGNPSGLSGKIFFDDQFAMDGAVGVARSEFDVHLTLLWHNFSFLSDRGLKPSKFNGETPVYLGVGPRVLFEHETEFGIRFPVGMSMFPDSSNWEFFGEVAPVFRLTPDTGFNADYAIGARYYFRTLRPRETQ